MRNAPAPLSAKMLEAGFSLLEVQETPSAGSDAQHSTLENAVRTATYAPGVFVGDYVLDQLPSVINDDQADPIVETSMGKNL